MIMLGAVLEFLRHLYTTENDCLLELWVYGVKLRPSLWRNAQCSQLQLIKVGSLEL